jgi:plastocyanin
MRRMRRLLAGGLVAAVALAPVAVPTRPARAGTGRTWTVIAGGAASGMAVVAQGFFPRTLEVAVGDSVSWRFEGWGFHTVTFLGGEQAPKTTVPEGEKVYLNPRVFFPAGEKTFDGTGYHNSGAPPEDPKAWPRFHYALTFTTPGTYDYVCLIHPGMSGRIVVKELVTESPAAALARGRQEQRAALQAGLAAWARFRPERKDGSVVLPLPGDTAGRWSIFRFSRQPVVIRRGTTVTWEMRDPFEIHAVTFMGRMRAMHKHEEFVLVQPQAQGAPRLQINPKIAVPTKVTAYDGEEYANSGILFPPGAPGPHSFALTFTKPGRYEYFCAVHDLYGMRGVIIVK